jgi:hypothetical protein
MKKDIEDPLVFASIFAGLLAARALIWYLHRRRAARAVVRAGATDLDALSA